MIHKDCMGVVEECECDIRPTPCPDALRFTEGLAILASIVERLILAGKWSAAERTMMLNEIDRVRDAARRDW